MDITVTLVPINLKGVEEPKRSERFSLTPVCADAEFCLTVKCRSPFAKFKVLISITNFAEKHLQATVCSRYDAVCVVNTPDQREIVFDGFAKPDDEGVTVPFLVGPLFAVRHAGRRQVRLAVNAIERQETMLKMFVNEAYIKTAWGALRGLFIRDNQEDVDLASNVAKFTSVTKLDIINAKSVNASNWVPAINYVTGRQLFTLVFIFKFI
ncbi:hypothetical protein Spob122 [Spilosoma obliqua nucleopolyhedrosis virus]|uniref:ORF135 peptide n=2 Tax=Alphabaculovirus TaxID=558016 RepID=Q2NP63_NPVHC|nr:ORF135 peptide [Hyphantria cunea nucleopolyhedrovirus]AUR45153.1 hypothetical protein Spob122 [Spilosoma obliqua nucleopolyhedrosis virus]QNN89312.1 ORF135 [Spilarctia obliqua nucleopolyhedrovirus]BAE72424.1 ORF135 peptide [Hyphantria cunea nucleopolyhedrovirus]